MPPVTAASPDLRVVESAESPKKSFPGKKPGVYNKVKKTYPLSGERQQGKSLVCILSCGHAALSLSGIHHMKALRKWCAICTREEKAKLAAEAKASAKAKKVAKRMVPSKAIESDPKLMAAIERMVQERVAQALEDMTSPKATPEQA